MSSEPDDDAPAAAAGPDRIPAPAPRYTPLYAALSRWLLATEAWLRSHGGRRLRWGLRGFWGAVALVGVVLLVGPVINKPLSLEDITGSASTATERWIARDFTVDYRLDRDESGGLRVHVEEKITAFFPDDISETGIERVLATQYEGHDLAPSEVEATMDGAPVAVGRTESPTQLTLTLGGSERLTGDHTFVLSYELRDLAYPAIDEASEQPVDLVKWDVFGPSWPQGLAGLDVRITLPAELDSELIRQPRGSIAWTLAGASAWLDRELGSGDSATYSFTNDQRIPPHAQAWFTLSFQPDTFTMPPPTPLFWVQTFGPLVPLAVLALTLLFAWAARAVAWADARGRPWFVAQYKPPAGIAPGMAAQILKTPAARELAVSLEEARTGPKSARAALFARVAEAARRAGRLGDRPHALAGYLTAPERRAQMAEGLRRVPRGFVRDYFIAAPLALTLVQWGVVRQLSHQVVLAVVWWPGAFVLVSSAISAVIVWIALSVRPLTRRGALAKQHLLGVGVYADTTLLLERAGARDELLPYAVLLADTRTAGVRVAALVKGPASTVPRRDRIDRFLSSPRLLIRVLSVALVAGAICVPIVVPNPYARGVDRASYDADVPGVIWTGVESFEAIAVLSRDAAGRARVEVRENLRVAFDEEATRVPQFAQQWPSTLDGQDLGLTVSAVRIDGEDVPFVTEPDGDTILVRTTMVAALVGTHDVEVDYALASAAVSAEGASGPVDRVRWAALLDGWKWNSQWGDALGPEPIRVTVRMPDDLAGQATESGWLTLDTESSDRARDWAPAVVPFAVGESADGVTSHTLELRPDENGSWPFELTLDDVGVGLDFPAGTFVGPSPGARQADHIREGAPFTAVVLLAGLGLALGVAGAVRGAVRVLPVLGRGAFRDLVRWLSPAATLAAAILFGWSALDLVGDDPKLAPMGFTLLAAIVACVAGLVLTRPSKD